MTFTCEKDEHHKESPKLDVTSAVKKPATCTETGVNTYTATVEFNGKTYTDTKDVADIPATGDVYKRQSLIRPPTCFAVNVVSFFKVFTS